MTSSIRILTTFSLDSSPALLLVSPSGESTLVNCGEVCQRAFLECPGLRTRSVKRVCLTHIGHDAVGGLPGMVLTTADVAIAAAAAASQQNETTPAKRKSPQKEEELPDMDIVGPEGTQAFLHSLRHFMRRDKFKMRVREGDYKQSPTDAPTSKRKRKRKGDTPVEGFYVQTIPLVHRWSGSNPDGTAIETQILSFVFTTPPIVGRFLPDKAKELGIPPGPLYAKLKMGQSVTFTDCDGVERTVESHQVVTKGCPGVAVAIVYCPSLDILRQLEQSPVLESLREEKEDSPVLDAMVHMTSHDLFHSPEYRLWMKRFPPDVDHIWLESVQHLAGIGQDRLSNAYRKSSPFRAATIGAEIRSLLHRGIFPSPRSKDCEQAATADAAEACRESSGMRITPARPMIEYVLIPRSRKGMRDNSTDNYIGERKEAVSQANESGAIELAKTATTGLMDIGKDAPSGEFIFTGTGSAIPCKQRNVTGMYLRMKNGNGMFLDAGEGTLGQLLRAKHPVDIVALRTLIQSVTAVWISHPHADHHLGLLRFLTERNTIVGHGADPVILMAPPNMFAFLTEYSQLDPSMTESYKPLDCREMDPKSYNQLGGELLRGLGITRVISVPVAHCPHSYAVVIDGTPFGRVAYSGDCRPSMAFADAGIDADLLIHEATFEDGMEDEATLKRHCTVGEALTVAKRMRARTVVLTHFSQRYPRIPPVRATEDRTNNASNPLVSSTLERQPDVAFAFDFMRLTTDTVSIASALTPALRLLYPSEKGTNTDLSEKEVGQTQDHSTTKEILSIPGLFARKELL